MKRYSLLSAFLAITLISVLLAWWVESSREPELFFLHVYAKNYKPIHDPYYRGNETPDNPVRIATISFVSGQRFQLKLPNEYNPTLTIAGRLRRRRDRFSGMLMIQIEAPETAFRHELPSHQTLQLDKRQDLMNDNFQIIVSRQDDPYTPRTR